MGREANLEAEDWVGSLESMVVFVQRLSPKPVV